MRDIVGEGILKLSRLIALLVGVLLAVVAITTPVRAASPPVDDNPWHIDFAKPITDLSKLPTHPGPRVGHPPRAAATHGMRYSMDAANWAGYAAHQDVGPAANTVLDVHGGLIVPTVACWLLQSGASAPWVGMGGAMGGAIEQAGVTAACNMGTPIYWSWIEVFPAVSQVLPVAVRPGDRVLIDSYYLTGAQFSFTTTNYTTNQGYSTTASPPETPDRSTADWIVENPTEVPTNLPLANFGTVQFGYCTATIFDQSTGAWVSSPIGGADHSRTAIFMRNGGITYAEPSPLNANGNAFTVMWKHS